MLDIYFWQSNKLFPTSSNPQYILQGNSNNFNSRKECFASCHPQEEDFQLSGSGESDNGEDVSEDDLKKLNLPIWLPFPIAPDSSPDSVCDLVQVSSNNGRQFVNLIRPHSGSRTMSSSWPGKVSAEILFQHLLINLSNVPVWRMWGKPQQLRKQDWLWIILCWCGL